MEFKIGGIMPRSIRQSKILEIISKFDIDTQDELVDKLKLGGFKVTQATISRDIKELGLTKILTDSGKYKYVHIDGGDQKISNKVINMFRESVISIKCVNNFIIIKTLSGTANAAALLIDKLGMEEILGSIAGDDTFLTITANAESAQNVVNKLNEISGN